MDAASGTDYWLKVTWPIQWPLTAAVTGPGTGSSGLQQAMPGTAVGNALNKVHADAVPAQRQQLDRLSAAR